MLKTKNELRKEAKVLRAKLFSEDKLKKILQSILVADFYIKAKNILAFYPLENEIDLRSLFCDETKNWFLPKMNGNTLQIARYTGESCLEKVNYGIMEPKVEFVEENPEIDLIFLPALMVDKKGYRLGYGKGYYDRFLSEQYVHATKVVPIFSELVCEELPHDKFDVKADIVVTDSK